MQRIDGPVPYYRFSDGWDGLTHGIFTRHGGVSDAPFSSLNTGGLLGDSIANVRRNHELMYQALGVDGARVVTTWQVHGVDVVYAGGPVQGRRWIAHADALVTDKPGLALVMRYADCTPIVAYDARKGVVGVAHAGWRGTVDGMAARLVQAMVTLFGCRPSELLAGVGPSIGPERYQVGEEVVRAVAAHFGSTDGLIRRDPADGSAYLNLWEANRRDLLRAGVEQVEVMGLCTATRTDEFFSHRAERGQTGRFSAVVML